jgi:hypothetical protein
MSMPTYCRDFVVAASNLTKAAQRIDHRHAPAAPPLTDYACKISLGTGADWLRWAASLQNSKFGKINGLNKERIPSLVELTRFYYAWTGANALFGRSEVLRVFAPGLSMTSSELTRFCALYTVAGVPQTDEAPILEQLHLLLNSIVNVRHHPWQPALQSTSILNVIYSKYSDQSMHRKVNYKRIDQVIRGTAPITSLDLPFIIYMTRNWCIHGALLNTGFRGPPAKFLSYISNVNSALGKVLLGGAQFLAVNV